MHLQEIFDLTLDQEAMPSTSCDMYLQSLKLLRPMINEMRLQENTLFDIDPMSKRSRSHKMLSSTLHIM